MGTWPSWLVLFLVLLAPANAFAQAEAGAGQPPQAPAAEQPPPTDNGLTPPKLTAFVDAGFPEEARAAGVNEASVTLVLTIGADGSVEEVSLSGAPVGHGFDEVAQSAAKRFVFEPAKKDGAP